MLTSPNSEVGWNKLSKCNIKEYFLSKIIKNLKSVSPSIFLVWEVEEMKPYFLLVQSLQALLTHTLTFAENVKNNFKEAKTGELLAHNICERKKN